MGWMGQGSKMGRDRIQGRRGGMDGAGQEDGAGQSARKAGWDSVVLWDQYYAVGGRSARWVGRAARDAELRVGGAGWTRRGGAERARGGRLCGAAALRTGLGATVRAAFLSRFYPAGGPLMGALFALSAGLRPGLLHLGVFCVCPAATPDPQLFSEGS